jgi:hypothetical protein
MRTCGSTATAPTPGLGRGFANLAGPIPRLLVDDRLVGRRAVRTDGREALPAQVDLPGIEAVHQHPAHGRCVPLRPGQGRDSVGHQVKGDLSLRDTTDVFAEDPADDGGLRLVDDERTRSRACWGDVTVPVAVRASASHELAAPHGSTANPALDRLCLPRGVLVVSHSRHCPHELRQEEIDGEHLLVLHAQQPNSVLAAQLT